MIYAGIGSRRTPESVLKDMELIGEILAGKDCILRSGGAEGADQAFERGCDKVKGKKEIYLPWFGFNNEDGIVPKMTDSLMEFSAKYHPNWDNLSQGAKKLMARNACQVFGITGDQPVDFIICWTPNGEITGGTGQALRIAKDFGIPVFNLGSMSLDNLDMIISEVFPSLVNDDSKQLL